MCGKQWVDHRGFFILPVLEIVKLITAISKYISLSVFILATITWSLANVIATQNVIANGGLVQYGPVLPEPSDTAPRLSPNPVSPQC